MAELLAVEGLTAGYGDGTVLEDVALSMEEGDSLALLGRNGMSEGADPLIADKPGDLRDCQVALFQIASGEIGAELVDYLVEG